MLPLLGNAGALVVFRVRLKIFGGVPKREQEGHGRCGSNQDILDHVPFHIGQAEVAPAVTVGESLMIQS